MNYETRAKARAARLAKRIEEMELAGDRESMFEAIRFQVDLVLFRPATLLVHGTCGYEIGWLGTLEGKRFIDTGKELDPYGIWGCLGCGCEIDADAQMKFHEGPQERTQVC
jgi:hypothetical protein